MSQLCGNAGWRVMRQLGQFVERQPSLALACAEHYVAQHVTLPPPACALASRTSKRCVVFVHASQPHVASLPAAGYSSAGNPCASASEPGASPHSSSLSPDVPAAERSG